MKEIEEMSLEELMDYLNWLEELKHYKPLPKNNYEDKENRQNNFRPFKGSGQADFPCSRFFRDYLDRL